MLSLKNLKARLCGSMASLSRPHFVTDLNDAYQVLILLYFLRAKIIPGFQWSRKPVNFAEYRLHEFWKIQPRSPQFFRFKQHIVY